MIMIIIKKMYGIMYIPSNWRPATTVSAISMLFRSYDNSGNG